MNAVLRRPGLGFSLELEAAYCATTYRVMLPCGPMALRVGQAAPVLDAWLNLIGAHEWYVLTAFNPTSQFLCDADNWHRQDLLHRILLDRGVRVFHGENHSDTGVWPCEASFFLLGLDAGDVMVLAKAFEQNAFLGGNRGFSPRLLWT